MSTIIRQTSGHRRCAALWSVRCFQAASYPLAPKLGFAALHLYRNQASTRASPQLLFSLAPAGSLSLFFRVILRCGALVFQILRHFPTAIVPRVLMQKDNVSAFLDLFLFS